MSSYIKISVDNASILVTGKVKKPEEKIKVTQLIWEIKGVEEVNNELQITDTSNIKEYRIKDAASQISEQFGVSKKRTYEIALKIKTEFNKSN